MGMYTELVLKCSIYEDILETVKTILNNLFNGTEDVIEEYPDHPLFKTDRWTALGRGCSYYHIPWSTSKYKDDYLFSRSDIKNYNSEIELFLDWLNPYIDEQIGVCIGWIWYEEEDTPTLIYKM